MATSVHVQNYTERWKTEKTQKKDCIWLTVLEKVREDHSAFPEVKQLVLKERKLHSKAKLEC